MKIRIALGLVFALTFALALKLQAPIRAQNPPDLEKAPAPVEPPPPLPPIPVDGITFAAHRDVVYLPAREVAKLLDWPLRWDRRTRTVWLNGIRVPRKQSHWLLDRTLVVALPWLKELEVDMSWDAEHQGALLVAGEHTYLVRSAPKRVAVNRARQQLRAWQGSRLVLATRVSTGKRGDETPRGSYKAGPLKTRMLISRKYDDAEMPWSVQVRGSVMIHGSKSVPRYAASHGCIRVPLSGQNPAKWIYDWIDLGTPIVIADRWPKSPTAARPREDGKKPAGVPSSADSPARYR